MSYHNQLPRRGVWQISKRLVDLQDVDPYGPPTDIDLCDAEGRQGFLSTLLSVPIINKNPSFLYRSWK